MIVECLDDAGHRAEQAQQRRDAGNRAQHAEEAFELVHDVAPGIGYAFDQDVTCAVAVREPRRDHLAERRVLLERRDHLVIERRGSRSTADLLVSSFGMTRFSCRVQSRSTMIAAAAMEHRMIGHMT